MKHFNKLNEIKFNCKVSIKEVLKSLSSTISITENRSFVIIVDDLDRCVGIISDGDIRRYLLSKNSTMDDPISIAMNKDFKYVNKNASFHQILRKFDERITNLPVLDTDKKVVDLYQYSKFVASARNEKLIIRARVPDRICYSGGGTDMSN